MLKILKTSKIRLAVQRFFHTDDYFIKKETRHGLLKIPPIPKSGGEHMVTLISGTTLLGRSAASNIRRLFESAMVPVIFERLTVGPDKQNFDEVLYSVLRNRAALQVCAPHSPTRKHEIHMLYSYLDLFASVTKLRSYPGFNCRHPKAKITLITQNYSGDLSKFEYEPVEGVVETLRIFHDHDMRKYLRFVFNYAEKYDHSKITIGHKQDKLPLSEGHFLKIAEDLRQEKYKDIKVELMDINNLVLSLVMQPDRFDLICTTATYGSFVAAVASAVCGGAGLFSAVEMGDTHAIFKPLAAKLSLSDVHVLCPYGIVRSCIDLLEYLGNTDCAIKMEEQLLYNMLTRKVITTTYGGTDTHDYVISRVVNGLICNFAS